MRVLADRETTVPRGTTGETGPATRHDRRPEGERLARHDHADRARAAAPLDEIAADDRREQIVLIIEDSRDLRDMIAQLVQLEGLGAHAVANGHEALAYLRRGRIPSLILLDLMMPVMDGWAFRREQRRDRSLAGVPVVVLSAADPARSADFEDVVFLTKPLDLDRLLDLVRHHCLPDRAPARAPAPR